VVLADDTRRVVAAMRSGEWLRTQWIARVAFELGAAPWRPEHASRVLATLRRLEADGRVERRDVLATCEGVIAAVAVQFSIPRNEWRLRDHGEREP
jgi:hypothetical protein